MWNATARWGGTCSKWAAALPGRGCRWLVDRSSAPTVVANRTDEHTIEAIAALRRLRFSAPEIAELSTGRDRRSPAFLPQIGMGQLGRLGLEPAERYERAAAGELIHIDVKKPTKKEIGTGSSR
jgi:hypothetical protein